MECKMMEEVRVLFVLLEESRCSGCLVFDSRSQLPSTPGEGDGEFTGSSQVCSMISSLSSSDEAGEDETFSSLRE